MERIPAQGGRQPHGRDSERHHHPRLHRPHAQVLRRLHRAATALRRHRQHALQRHLHPRYVGPVTHTIHMQYRQHRLPLDSALNRDYS
ncbi:hypothetical protein SBA6_710019 [Candidatus Sulfopaludibacter sp. SbA6]|nr:hypothetical protein SBA6_710019 [Candidatus Sulfopaludibacter sp. SbA6]